VQNDLGIPDTFIAEIDFDSLDFDLGKAIAYSKYQAVYRDLSIVVEKNITLTQIENTLNKLDDTIMKNFTIIDRYTDEKLDNKMSLTLRFKLQSLDKTLEEEDINPYIDTILAHLAQDVNAELR
jgi:phenylalanyl-tRNA synthetase beta chain